MGKIRFIYTKIGIAKWTSHLDLTTVFRRAFNRAGIALTHSQGFNPHPYLSVALPMPVGAESVCEMLDVKLENPPEDNVLTALNAALPPGLEVIGWTDHLRPLTELAATRVMIQLDAPPDDLSFLNAPFLIEKKSKKGMVTLDIVPFLSNVNLDGNILTMTLAAKPEGAPGFGVIIKALAQFEPTDMRRVAVLDAGGNDFMGSK